MPDVKGVFKNNQDLSLTSSALHIHYNTLKYRINKIIELTDLSFSDKTIFRLHLSFIVFDYLTETGKIKFIEMKEEAG